MLTLSFYDMFCFQVALKARANVQVQISHTIQDQL